MAARTWIVPTLLFALASGTARAAPTAGQSDTFDNGDLMSWEQGMVDSITGEATGGPDGANDGYIQVTSTGGSMQNSRMTVFNTAIRWTGNWLTPEIGQVDVHLKNDSAQALQIRLKFESGIARVYSLAQTVPADGQWALYSFSLAPGSFEGPGDPKAVLSSVTTFRIEHNPNAIHPPPVIAAVLGIDNVTAAAATWTCGNATVDGFEVCDGSDLDSTTCADLAGFDDGTLACAADCMTFDTTGCTECGDGTCEGNETEVSCPADCTPPDVCGDGQITGNEVCEPADLQGETCQSQGFDRGTLACASSCLSFDTTGCENCPGGDCDGDDGGCSCRAAAAGRTAGVLAVLFVLVLFALRRRHG